MIILLQLRSLSEKEGFGVFQNFLLSLILIMSNFEKYSCLVLRLRFVQKFLVFFHLLQFKSVLYFKYKFFILEGNMIPLRKALLIKEFSLAS